MTARYATFWACWVPLFVLGLAYSDWSNARPNALGLVVWVALTAAFAGMIVACEWPSEPEIETVEATGGPLADDEAEPAHEEIWAVDKRTRRHRRLTKRPDRAPGMTAGELAEQLETPPLYDETLGHPPT